MFYCTKINKKTVLKSDIIDAEHFFTTRDICIKSKEPEMLKIVSLNKHEVCDYLKIDYDSFISPNQTHSANIDIATKRKGEYPQTDALITTSNDIAVYLNFADCTPIILYDNVRNIGAVVHAGWRGTAAKISVKTLKKLEKEYGCREIDIAAAIGPTIGFCCYNVGEDVYIQLKSTVNNFDELSEIRSGNIYVDLKGINARQLAEYGLLKIDIAPYCTCCNNDMFFSYRKENGTTNRHSAVLKIN